MVDLQTVCCMCGDVGFPDKLFRCNKCRDRFQHSYCSNYYREYAEPIELCDWCRSDQERSTTRHGSSSKKSSMVAGGGVDTGGASSRSEYSGITTSSNTIINKKVVAARRLTPRTTLAAARHHQEPLRAGTSFSRMSCVNDYLKSVSDCTRLMKLEGFKCL